MRWTKSICCFVVFNGCFVYTQCHRVIPLLFYSRTELYSKLMLQQLSVCLTSLKNLAILEMETLAYLYFLVFFMLFRFCKFFVNPSLTQKHLTETFDENFGFLRLCINPFAAVLWINLLLFNQRKVNRLIFLKGNNHYVKKSLKGYLRYKTILCHKAALNV